MHKGRGKTETAAVKKYAVSVLVGACIGLAAFLLLLLLCSIMMLKVDLPDSVIYACGLASSSIGAILAGFSGARMVGHKGIAFGAAAAVVFLAVVLFILGLYTKSLPMENLLVLVPVVILFGCIGGILAVNMKRRVK